MDFRGHVHPADADGRSQQSVPGFQCDVASIQQVFWNLLNNTIKFTPEGGAIIVDSSLSRRYQKTMLNNKISMGSLTIFLVENHEDTVRYMQLFLEQFGYKVSVAADMTTALREIPKSRCDVLISDIGLPDGDGWQLMEKLGEHRPQFAIAMSGYGTSNDQNKSRDAGYVHHLVKPFIPDALLALLREAEKTKETQS